MEAMTEGVFNAATFCRLAEMFNSPYRDEANALLKLALSDLKKSHNLLCDQCGNPGYAKARHDECAGLRFDLKQAFADYADGELNADEVQEIIARVAVRSAEIEHDVFTSSEISDTGHHEPEPVAFPDFVIPSAVVLPSPAAVIEPESEPDGGEDDSEDEAPQPFRVRLKERVSKARNYWPEYLWPWALLLSMFFWFTGFAVLLDGVRFASVFFVSWSRLWFWLLIWPATAEMFLRLALYAYEALRLKVEDDENDELVTLDSILDFIEDIARNKTLCGFLCLVMAFVVFAPAITSDGFKLEWPSPPSLPSFPSLGILPEIAAALVAGVLLLWLFRKLLPLLGVVGLFLKLALFIDGVFACYVVGFHETPWRFLGGASFPALAQPVWPFVIVCVLAAGILIMPEVAEWFRAKSSRLRLVFLLAIALIVITGFVIRDRATSPPLPEVITSSPESVRPAGEQTTQPETAAPEVIPSPWLKVPESARKHIR